MKTNLDKEKMKFSLPTMKLEVPPKRWTGVEVVYGG